MEQQYGILVHQQYGIYTRSCLGVLRGACSCCVLVWLCGQRADDAQPSLVARFLLLLCRPGGTRTCDVGTAVCGQRADALPSLVARSHALVYLWCRYNSMVSILTRSCSHALVYLWCWYSIMVSKLASPALLPCRHALVHLTLCHRSSRARMLLCTGGVGKTVWYLYPLLLCRSEYMILCICGVCWYSSMMVSILVQSSYGLLLGWFWDSVAMVWYMVRHGVAWCAVWHGM